MGSRLELHEKLTTFTPNVYFQPPKNIQMQYDAIVYHRSAIQNTYADNSVYKQDNAYELTVIYRDPDSDLPVKVSKLPKCSFDRHFVSENLNHDVFTLYY